MQRPPSGSSDAAAASPLSRFETAIVAILVLGLTVSAVVTPHAPPPEGTAALCVPHGGLRDADSDRLEAFARRVEHHVGEDVEVVRCGDEWPARCRLAVMSVHEYRRLRDSSNLKAVASMWRPKSAVIIAGARGEDEFGSLGPHDVLFTAPRAINGCWLQLRALAAAGREPAGGLDGLRFAPPPGNPERVVYEVARGRSRAGAVPGGVLEAMVSDGRIHEGEVRVVHAGPPLAETVLCARGEAVEDAVSLIGIGGELRPLPDSEAEKLDSLFAWVESLGTTGNP